MEGSHSPLISDEVRHAELQYDPDGADDDTASELSKSEAKPGIFVLLLTFAAGISGLLFGCELLIHLHAKICAWECSLTCLDDTGVISATLVSVGSALSDRPLTSMDKSIITSSTSLFALIISPFSSILADKLGRKRVILYADVLFIVGALVQAYSSTVTLMVVGRCIVGAAVGAASFVVPLYIAEVAPASHRGRLVTMNVLFITLGQAVAYIVGWAFSSFGSESSGWRWMVGLGALPALVQAVIVAFMPETPRWLVKVGDSAGAKLVIQKVNGGTATSTRNADAVVKDIEIEAREEQEMRRLREHQVAGPWKWLGAWQELLSEGKNRRALAIACLLQGLQQLCGFVSASRKCSRKRFRVLFMGCTGAN